MWVAGSTVVPFIYRILTESSSCSIRPWTMAVYIRFGCRGRVLTHFLNILPWTILGRIRLVCSLKCHIDIAQTSFCCTRIRKRDHLNFYKVHLFFFLKKAFYVLYRNSIYSWSFIVKYKTIMSFTWIFDQSCFFATYYVIFTIYNIIMCCICILSNLGFLTIITRPMSWEPWICWVWQSELVQGSC